MMKIEIYDAGYNFISSSDGDKKAVGITSTETTFRGCY